MTFPVIPAFYFDSVQLKELADQHRSSYKSAAPFPYVVIDHFLPDDIISLLAREFPSADEPFWELDGPGNIPHTHDRGIEKLRTSADKQWNPFTRHFMGQLSSAVFLEFLESLTETPRLITDLECGMHSTGRVGGSWFMQILPDSRTIC